MRGWTRRTALMGMAAFLFQTGVAAAGSLPSWLRSRRFPTWLTVFDQLAPPGETVSLHVKLYQTTRLGFHINLHDRQIEFRCPFLPASATQTGEDGLASVEVQPPMEAPEVWRFTADYRGGVCHQPAVSNGRVFLWPTDSCLLVTDIDGTICDLAEFRVPFTSNRNTPTLPGCVEALNALAVEYRIVYLSARDECLYDKTRDWLREKGFPAGPLFCRDMHLTGSQEEFKTKFLADLAKRYPRLRVGVGDRLTDVRAYRANGMRAFLIDPTGRIAVPPGTVVVPSWRAVPNHLLRPSGILLDSLP